MTLSRALKAGVLLLFSASLFGCAPKGVDVPERFQDLPRCSLVKIKIEDLAASGAPGCDLEGSEVIAPDGLVLGIGPVGDVTELSFSSSDNSAERTFMIVNWGVPGVAVSATHEESQIWASTPEAEKLQKRQLML
ncbi:hypothetical protein [Leucobacter manosquensis]|uniref:Uncharacterized protein n=1 Tax=Leucobacter manosquensis TaxID=2810611 RepID=A0ABS5M5Z1_9MICO|nr:hypothetical protein [Leucobacter manosquensis]MBS3182381.1 hypothetical protein [Leucobacter manosquensis]